MCIDLTKCLLQELAEIRQVLEVREQKMIEMSRETISLTETNQSLHEELTEAKRMGQTDIEDLRSEFTRRLATTEKKLQAVVKVKVQYQIILLCTRTSECAQHSIHTHT